MYTRPIEAPTRAAPPPHPDPEGTEPDALYGAVTARVALAPRAYDGVLLLVVMQELESQRLALEWLLERDLLGHCMA